jgi:7-cyano-7-deazaguanine synthase
VTGVCAQDRSGYPDCRAEFVTAMQEALRIGLDWPEVHICAPLLNKTKAETWALAAELDVLPEIVLFTHTCYEGVRGRTPHEWGYGCGECGACLERARGYTEFTEARRVPARA